MSTFVGFKGDITQNIIRPQITTTQNQINIHICLVPHTCSSAQLLLQNVSTKFAEKYITAPPKTIIRSQSTTRQNILHKTSWINVKIADNGTWTRTSRAEVCYATPTTSYPHGVFTIVFNGIKMYKKIRLKIKTILYYFVYFFKKWL